MRIEWQKYFDRGIRPDDIRKDPLAYPWYDDSKKSILYRAYRNWKKKNADKVKEIAIAKLAKMPVVERQTEETVVAVVANSIQELAQQIALESLKFNLYRMRKFKQAIDSIDLDSVPETMRLRVADILSRYG